MRPQTRVLGVSKGDGRRVGRSRHRGLRRGGHQPHSDLPGPGDRFQRAAASAGSGAVQAAHTSARAARISRVEPVVTLEARTRQNIKPR